MKNPEILKFGGDVKQDVETFIRVKNGLPLSSPTGAHIKHLLNRINVQRVENNDPLFLDDEYRTLVTQLKHLNYVLSSSGQIVPDWRKSTFNK